MRLLVSSAIFGYVDCGLANAAYAKILAKAPSVKITKTSRHYTYSHQKFWIVDGESVGFSTGNWGESDFPADSDSDKPVTCPPFGRPLWQKLNRDFTVYITSSGVVKAFQAVFDGDSDSAGTFPSKVYPWEPTYRVSCGNG